MNYIDPHNVTRWLDPFIISLLSSQITPEDKKRIVSSLIAAQTCISASLEKAIDGRMNDWIVHHKNAGNEDSVSLIEEISADLKTARSAF